ncbi:MAG: S9 family peptidase [Bacteroidetes bacterium]|nr:S9 family peptidase [Bacteroidota bacterium]
MKKLFLIALVLNIFINANAQQTKKQITLDDIWMSGIFYPRTMDEVVSMKDGEHYCMLENDIFINEYEYKTGLKSRTIARASFLIPEGESEGITIDEYSFSPDETKILIATNTEKIYRYSTISDYYIWDISNSKLKKLTKDGKQRLASFSPDGSKVVFLRDNNIFIKNLSTEKEEQITNDGLVNNIINGSSDWVYEEEFEVKTAYSWSPDGSMLAFYRFDESKVKEFEMMLYDSLYPTVSKFKYPKAGEDNSIVSIHVYNLKTGKTQIMDIGQEKDQYIPRIKWTEESNILSIQRMNRLQNKLEILLADATTGASKIIYTEQNKYYIEISNNLEFLKNKKQFIFTSEKDGYNHIYLYDINGNLIKQLTSGKWNVIEIKGVNEKDQTIYFISNEESPAEKALYSVKLDGTAKKKLSAKEGTNQVEFSEGFKYYINTYSNSNTPHYVSINKADGKELKMLYDNSEISTAEKEYGFTPVEFFKFNTSENIELNAWMIKPPDFDANKKYPVFMYVYGGPGIQTVTNEWGYFDFVWFEMLAQKGYIIVSVDNRGTGGKGETFKKCTYGQLGKLETIDQIEAAKYLAGLNYIDASRIGIFGWSYGGYMTALCLTKGADYFKTGIAVAPVTNWRYYDNIYTERYMGLPKDNASGYDDNSPIKYVSKLKGNFLLIHGTADDNVHFQNSIELVKALVNANKQFDTFFYPNKNHSIYGGYTRYHLYKKLTDYILEKL